MMQQKKRQASKLGRPSQKKSQFIVKGIVKDPVVQDIEDLQENECLLAEAILQIPLHLKCISNTIKQLDKNNTINFCLTPNTMYIYFSEPVQENNCYIQMNCKHLLSYYFRSRQNDPNISVIKFELPVSHLANTFNFYNRSSMKTELRIFGPSKPVMRIDSHRTEKKLVQRIVNTINIRLQPGMDELKRINEFAEKYPEFSNCPNDLAKLDMIMNNKRMFNDCFFFPYRDMKVYSFQILNQEIRKFITEVQKDSQRIYIIRQMVLEGDRQKLKQITIKANIPGSSSVKKIEHPAAQVNGYKQYGQEQEVEFTYSIGSDILKQICSTNPQSMLQFTMLNNGQIILKIKNQVSVFKFQFNPTDSF